MRKLKILATPRRVILFLILAVLVWFILLPKVDKLEFIGAVLITLLSYEGICLLLPADPEPFWEPLDDKNERWLELATRPDRKRSDTDPAPWADLIQQQHNIIKRHPKTNFIAAHFGWYPNDLAKLGSLLDAMPNMYVEFGAIIAELGRQPRMAKAFFDKYQDRIMFGKDSWVPEEYPTYFRVLETNDEYFPYHKKYHAFWKMYGMGLSDDVLKKVYYKNALRIIPNIDKTLFPD